MISVTSRQEEQCYKSQNRLDTVIDAKLHSVGKLLMFYFTSFSFIYQTS